MYTLTMPFIGVSLKDTSKSLIINDYHTLLNLYNQKTALLITKLRLSNLTIIFLKFF